MTKPTTDSIQETILNTCRSLQFVSLNAGYVRDPDTLAQFAEAVEQVHAAVAEMVKGVEQAVKETPAHAIRVALKEPGEPARAVDTRDALPALQALVGGYLETTRVILVRAGGPLELDLYFNEDGRELGLTPNITIGGGTTIVGPVFAAQHDAEGNTLGLADADLELALTMLDAGTL